MKNCIKEELAKLLKSNVRFIVTLDEYTSNSNRTYMNVNLHYKSKVWILGLTRIFDSMPAERAKYLLEEKLKEFGIQLNDDVVAVTTDGASIMTKMGTFFKPIHQLCFANDIHLTVCDLLYDPELHRNSSEVLLDLSDPFKLSEVYDNILDDKEVCDTYDIDMVIPILKNRINRVILKVRRIAKLLRKFQTKNDTLQTYVRGTIMGRK